MPRSARTRLAALCSITAAVAAVAAPSPLQAKASGQRALLSDDFDSYAIGLLKDSGGPGLAFAAIKVPENDTDEVIVDFRNYGIAGPNKTVDSNTIMGIGSNTKHLTAAAIGVLVDQGKLNWTSRIVDILPDFALMDPVASKEATLIDILSHQTGLPEHDNAPRLNQSAGEVSHELRFLRPSAESRSTFQYNNLMFTLAAHIISNVSGVPFTTFIASHFFTPLNLTSTSYFPRNDSSLSSRLSSGYLLLENKTEVEIPYAFDSPLSTVENFGGAGGVASTTTDFVKWLSFLIRQHRRSANSSDGSAPTANDKILSSAQVGHITNAYTIGARSTPYPDSSPALYCQGLLTTTYQGANIFSDTAVRNCHPTSSSSSWPDLDTGLQTGGVPGFGSRFWWQPDSGVGVVALTNVYDQGADVSDIVGYRALEELLGLKKIDWVTRIRPSLEPNATASSATASNSGNTTGLTPLEVNDYVGTYYDAGYGKVSVCAPPSAQTPPTGDCEKLYDRLNGSIRWDVGAEDESSKPDLYIAFERVFSQSHIVLKRDDVDHFTGSGKAVYRPVGSRTRNALMDSLDPLEVLAQFVREEEGERKVKAMQWGGNVWVAGVGVPDQGQHEVQVMFAKV